MKLWRGWPRWLRVVAAVVVPGVLLLTYLVMVNVVLKPRVILEIRGRFPGAKASFWHEGMEIPRILKRLPAELDISDAVSRGNRYETTLWRNCYWPGEEEPDSFGYDLFGGWTTRELVVTGWVDSARLNRSSVLPLQRLHWSLTRHLEILFDDPAFQVDR